MCLFWNFQNISYAWPHELYNNALNVTPESSDGIDPAPLLHHQGVQCCSVLTTSYPALDPRGKVLAGDLCPAVPVCMVHRYIQEHADISFY